MPTVSLDPIPDHGSYGRVLRRYDRDTATSRPRIPGYAVTVTSRRCELDGRVAFTAFFPPTPAGEAAATRAAKLGWIDETDTWAAEHGPSGTATIEQTVRDMGWADLREAAKAQSIRTGARPRAEVEAELIAAYNKA